jgi:TonB family protein
MNAFPAIEGLERFQERVIRRTMVLSVAAHAAVFLLGSAISPLFPSMPVPAPVFVELIDAPMSELPEEPPAPLPQVASEVRTESAGAPAHVPLTPPPKKTPTARRWLEKLDAGIPKVPEAPIERKEGKAGGIPVRHWTNEGPAKPGDFAPAVAPERTAALGKHVEELEARVRRGGRPMVGSGKESEASMMFGGTGGTAGEPIPAWVRDMIRKRVRDYLPELEGAYTDAIRRNPKLKGKMVVRFRIDPSGKVPLAVSVESSLEDGAFIAVVLEKIRHWTFEPLAGQTVEVLYPFVFVAPS